MPEVRPITRLSRDDLQPLLEASLAEGYDFVQQLWEEYQSGVNRFDAGGAALLGVYDGDVMIAIGGVHPDPYLQQAEIGRIRHVYVLPQQRRAKVGRALMLGLIDHARAHFRVLTLRTLTAHGDAFYVTLGFSREPRFEQATHWLTL